MAVAGEPRRRRIAVTGAASGGVLALVGSFVPLLTVEMPIDESTRQTLSLSAWGVDSDAAAGDQDLSLLVPAPVIGFALVAAAVLLVAAAAASARTGPAGPCRGATTSAVVVAAGTAFLAGVAWPVGMQTLWYARLFGYGATHPLRVPMTLGPGLWLLGAGVVLAVAAAVAAWLRTREPRPARPAEDDVATPPMGIPVVTPVDPPAGPDRP